MRITSIDRPPRKQRYEVRIDYDLIVPLSPEVLAQANLRPGQDLTGADLKALEELQHRHSALATAHPRARSCTRCARLTRGIEQRRAVDHPGALDERDAACRAASRRARSLPALPFVPFRRRIGDHLLRRGFTHETARAAVRRIWEE